MVRSVSSVTGGQAITVKNVNGTDAVNLVDFGFREGMLMSHMIAGYGRMVTTAVSINGSNVQKMFLDIVLISIVIMLPIVLT